MTAQTFRQRTAYLRRITGAPRTLRGQVTVDQVYAHYQHERTELHHPRGGGPFYLQKPLFEHFKEYLDLYAREVLKGSGDHAMATAMEHLSDSVEVHAPREFGNLGRSGHPEVFTGERQIYDREPKMHRLTEAELKFLNRLRHLPPALIGYIWWHVMHHQHPPAHLRGHHG
jgi:hypothetical protein